MKNLVILNHPLVKTDLTILRDKNTGTDEFRKILNRLAGLIAYEVMRDLKIKKINIKTPLEKTGGYILKQKIVLVPILRAGLGFVEGFTNVLPDVRIGHIGLYRDENTLKPVNYYLKVPGSLEKSLVIILDPMLATGGSVIEAISCLKKKGARELRVASLVTAPEGLNAISKAYPGIKIYTCALDRKLNNRGYILPGLGDAGDRIYGTE